MIFQQQGPDQQIHQFLGVISNLRRYNYKIWEIDGAKLTSNPAQAGGAGSNNTGSFKDVNPFNNKGLLLLPDNQQDTASLISEHKSPRLPWPKPANDTPGCIR